MIAAALTRWAVAVTVCQLLQRPASQSGPQTQVGTLVLSFWPFASASAHSHTCVSFPSPEAEWHPTAWTFFFFFFRSTLKNHLAFGSRLMRAASFVKPCVKGGELLKSFGKTGKRPAGCRRRRLPSDPCTTPNKQREKGWREREARCNI